MVPKSPQAARRLSEIAIGHWDRIEGHYAGQGVQLLTYPFPRFLNVILTWALEHMSQEDGEKFLKTLDSPEGSTAVPDEEFDDSFDQINQQ